MLFDNSNLGADEPVLDYDQVMNWDLSDDWYFPSSQDSMPAFSVDGQYSLQNLSPNVRTASRSIPSNWAPSNLRPVSTAFPISSTAQLANWAPVTLTDSNPPPLYRSHSPSIDSLMESECSTGRSNWAESAFPSPNLASSCLKSPSRAPSSGTPDSTSRLLSPRASSRSKSPSRLRFSQHPWATFPEIQRPITPPASSHSRSPNPNAASFPKSWDEQQVPRCASSTGSTRSPSPRPAYPYPSTELSSKKQFRNTRDFISQLESSLPYAEKSDIIDTDIPTFRPATAGASSSFPELSSHFLIQSSQNTKTDTDTNIKLKSSPSDQPPTTSNLSSNQTTSLKDHDLSSSPSASHITPSPSRRRLQNLAAQRAFRSRQKAHVATLEQEVMALKAELKSLQSAYTSLAIEFARERES